jgi:hypothetical protein
MDQLPASHVFRRSAYYAGIKVFSSLPSSLTGIVNKKAQFETALKIYLIIHSFFPSGAHNSGYGEWHPRGTQCPGV